MLTATSNIFIPRNRPLSALEARNLLHSMYEVGMITSIAPEMSLVKPGGVLNDSQARKLETLYRSGVRLHFIDKVKEETKLDNAVNRVNSTYGKILATVAAPVTGIGAFIRKHSDDAHKRAMLESKHDVLARRSYGRKYGGIMGGEIASRGTMSSAIRAALICEQNAKSKSTGYCARAVRQALAKAGFKYFKVGRGNAFQYGKHLKNVGFISLGQLPHEKCRVGDIVVFDPIGSHKYGHIAILGNHGWVSDFKQSGFYPAHAYRRGSYTIYRLIGQSKDPNVPSDGSDGDFDLIDDDHSVYGGLKEIGHNISNAVKSGASSVARFGSAVGSFLIPSALADGTAADPKSVDSWVRHILYYASTAVNDEMRHMDRAAILQLLNIEGSCTDGVHVNPYIWSGGSFIGPFQMHFSYFGNKEFGGIGPKFSSAAQGAKSPFMADVDQHSKLFVKFTDKQISYAKASANWKRIGFPKSLDADLIYLLHNQGPAGSALSIIKGSLNQDKQSSKAKEVLTRVSQKVNLQRA